MCSVVGVVVAAAVNLAVQAKSFRRARIKRYCSNAGGVCHETVRECFPMARLLPASAHVGPHPYPRNSNYHPNPKQRPTWLVCQVVVMLGRAIFAVGARLRKFI